MTHLTFIAGGSKGLGAAMVKSFQTENHEVYEFSRTGKQSIHIDCDFGLPSEAKAVFEATFHTHSNKDYQSINLLINTAILPPFGALAMASNNQINAHLAINIDSTVFLIQSFLSAFQNKPVQKTITYLSSGAARRAIPGLAMYSASKAFFERLVNTIAEEQKSAAHPFKCILVNPGVMDTGMQSEIRAQSVETFPMVKMWNDLHHKGLLANPADVAAVCTDLVINSGVNGSYYTAQDLIPTNSGS